MNALDNLLNRLTMYRLVLYSLILLLGVAILFGFLGLLPYTGFSILLSAGFILVISLIANYLFSISFNVPTNPESTPITALILALIITPPKSWHDYIFLFWASVLSIASKYIFNLRGKHLFNPVAIAVFLTSMGINQSATWWVGSRIMFPVVLITGLLIVRKLRRFDLVFYFFLPALTIPIVIGFLKNDTLIAILERTLLDSPYLFFSTYMLTEPLTTPPTAKLQAIYGAIVGLLTPPQVHLGGLYFTPEIALLIGNIFSYLVSFKQRLTLSLKAILPAGTGAFDFVFATHSPLKFNPGQYMEWTLGHSHPDTRGVRRFFTIASAPSETEVRLGVKISDPSSSFKRRLQSLKPGDTIIASQLAGDFTLPDDPKIPLVFIAGGIGITPFRSMIKYLVNKNEFRPVTILYFNKTSDEIAYEDVFKEANESLGVKVIYALTDKDHLPSGWTGEVGRLTPEMVTKYIPDYKSPLYYLSGPNAMVEANNKILESMGISKNNIKTDYFPGF